VPLTESFLSVPTRRSSDLIRSHVRVPERRRRDGLPGPAHAPGGLRPRPAPARGGRGGPGRAACGLHRPAGPPRGLGRRPLSGRSTDPLALGQSLTRPLAQPARDEGREWAREELSDPVYREADMSLFERIGRAINDFFSE